MRSSTIALVVLVVLANAGCGESTPAEATSPADAIVEDTFSPADDTSALADTLVLDDSAPPADSELFGAYPAGPYGNKLGDVVANLAWEGYVSPFADALANTKPYVTTSMDKLRRDATKGYALVHVSEYY